MLLRRIFSAPINLRKWIFTPQLSIVHRFCQTDDDAGLRRYPLKNKNDYYIHEPFPIVKMLSVLEMNEQTIEGHNVLSLMSSIMRWYKQEKLEGETLHKHDLFKKACGVLHSNMDKLDTAQAIEILKILNRLKVSTSSRLVSSLLHTINVLLDTSTMEEFCKFSTILPKLASTPSTRAMKKSLHKKYLLKLSTEFDEKNLKFSVDAMRYAIYNLKDRKLLNKLMNVVENHEFNNEATSTIVSLMNTLALFNYYPKGWKRVLNKTLEYLTKNVGEISNDDIIFLSRNIAMKIRNERVYEFYNKTLFDKFIEKLISEDVGLTKGVSFLDSLNELLHTNKQILNYVSAKYYEDKYLNKNVDIKFEMEKLLVLVSGLAFIKYKPIFWDEIFRNLKTKNILRLSDETLIIYSVHLACLDCFDPMVLEKIFTSKLNLKKYPFVHWSFLRLYQKLKMMTDYNGPLPSQDLLDSCLCLQRKESYPLLPYLEQAFGGSMYVKTSLQTKLLHRIDHLVVFRPGGYPVAVCNQKENDNNLLNEPVEYIEDLNVPLNCEFVIILSTPIKWYSRSTSQLLGPHSLYLETLEALSYKVVTICDKTWWLLPDNAKIPFLMNEIKSKLDYQQQSIKINHALAHQNLE